MTFSFSGSLGGVRREGEGTKLGGSTETDQKSEMASGEREREDDAGERLRLEVEANLMCLTVEGLGVVAEELEIRQGRYLNRGKLVILREIRSQLDKNEADPYRSLICTL